MCPPPMHLPPEHLSLCLCARGGLVRVPVSESMCRSLGSVWSRRRDSGSGVRSSPPKSSEAFGGFVLTRRPAAFVLLVLGPWRWRVPRVCLALVLGCVLCRVGSGV